MSVAEAGSQTFTSSGTFYIPDYATLSVTVNGAGGGEGGGSGDVYGCSCGKSCTTCCGGVSGSAGSSGTVSSFNSSVIGNGGGGGGGGASCSNGSNGTASGGDTNTTGGGASGGTGSSNGCAGGAGGKAIKAYSIGAFATGTAVTVVVGTGGAGGAGGGDATCGIGPNGATGSSGSVAITWTSPGATITFTKAATISKGLSVTYDISKGSGTFVIDHPLDPRNKLLYHSFVESPDAKNMYDGIATLDRNGEATVRLPAYFDALNTDVRYQLKPIGAPMPNLHVKEEEKGNHFMIGGGISGGKVSWQITGNRQDPYILANPIIPEVEKGPGKLVDKGEYLFQEWYAPEGTENAFGGFMRDLFWGLITPFGQSIDGLWPNSFK